LSRRNLLNLALLLVLLYVLVPQLGKFHTSLATVGHAQLNWILVGFGLAIATYAAAALLYCLLAKKRLRYGRTLLVQVASMFANRLLPAGIGAISVNYEYLRRNKHTRPEAAAVVAANNTLGFLGHILLIGSVVTLTRAPFQHLELPHVGTDGYWLIAGLIIIVLVLAWMKRLRHWLLKMVRSTVRNLAGYRAHPLKILAALACSMALTSIYVLCLQACTQAVGVHLAFAQVLLVLTVGVVGGTVAPTPGGLVGAEAGLVAGLMAYGVASADALAITLLYRLLTYWLALMLGAVAFAVVRQKAYL
jgi:uncharacterized membrane protein YbhN (UPF0104 family)